MPGGTAPTKAHPSDAGWDLYSAEDTIIYVGSQKVISCGFCMELPKNYEAQIRPRSGLAAKHMISVTNSPGTIDSNYRGTVKVILINHARHCENHFVINKGDRIAQMVIKKVEPSEYTMVDELSETDRGDGGFGSSGK